MDKITTPYTFNHNSGHCINFETNCHFSRLYNNQKSIRVENFSSLNALVARVMKRAAE